MAEAKTAAIALCPGCREPLVATFAFSGYEFLCIGCGRRVTFFGPTRGDGNDPALQKRLAEVQAEWDENVGGKLLPRSRFRRKDCERCAEGHDHWEHITDAERRDDEQAHAWLAERTS